MSCDARRAALRKTEKPNSLYIPWKDISSGNPTWAVGITVSYRERPTLHGTLKSLRSAGWSNPTLYCEPDVNVDVSQSRTVVNNEKLGAWKNFTSCISDLAFNTDADKILYIQDDVEILPDTRDWLEQNWPINEGIHSLYRSSRYVVDDRNEGQVWDTLGYSKAFLGALAVAMSRDLAISLALNIEAMTDPNPKQIDIKVGRFAHWALIPINIAIASRCQHTGDTSSIYENARNKGTRRSSTYVV